MLLITSPEGEIYLEKRPSTGIWGGLWSLPECDKSSKIDKYVYQLIQAQIRESMIMPSFRHTFSHYHLDITPVRVELEEKTLPNLEAPSQIWYNPSEPTEVGLPKPIKWLLQHIEVTA